VVGGERYSDPGDKRIRAEPYACARKQHHGWQQLAHGGERLRPCLARRSADGHKG
jgi:hypothetical protein